jgi:hypothetical protein
MKQQEHTESSVQTTERGKQQKHEFMHEYCSLYGVRVRRNNSFVQKQLIQRAADSLSQVMQDRFSLQPKTSLCKEL